MQTDGGGGCWKAETEQDVSDDDPHGKKTLLGNEHVRQKDYLKSCVSCDPFLNVKLGNRCAQK